MCSGLKALAAIASSRKIDSRALAHCVLSAEYWASFKKLEHRCRVMRPIPAAQLEECLFNECQAGVSASSQGR